MDVSSLCTPAFIYFVISFIYLIISSLKSFNIMSIIFNIVIIMVWSWILNFLCSNGFTIVSWVILILPFFVLFR